MNRQAFVTGFIKRANDHGINNNDAIEIIKQAGIEELLNNPSVIAALAGGAGGAALGGLGSKKHKGRNAILGGLAGAGAGYGGSELYKLLAESGSEGARYR